MLFLHANMKRLIHLLVFATLIYTKHSFGQIECAVDVTIAEGTAITMCDNALETLNASAGFVSYAWSGPETGTGSSITPNFSGQYVVAATDGIGCVSHDTIQVTIVPAPVDAIISSAGDTLCPGGTGTTLSLSGSYSLYNWTGGITSPTLNVTSGGTYSVSVADANSCVSTFVFTFTEIEFDVTVDGGGCMGSSSLLSASGGSSYLWSTGETSSSIVVNPSTTTNYSVQITQGSCTQQITTAVNVGAVPAYEMPDTIYIGVGDALYIGGPAGFINYVWSPAEAVDNTMSSGVNFIGTETTLLTVVATHADGCMISDNVLVIVVDLTIPTGFSPNNDLTNDTFVIPELALYDAELKVWNRWGELVYESAHYVNDWNGNCESDTCLGSGTLPDGTYFYMIDVHGVTFKGYITIRK